MRHESYKLTPRDFDYEKRDQGHWDGHVQQCISDSEKVSPYGINTDCGQCEVMGIKRSCVSSNIPNMALTTYHSSEIRYRPSAISKVSRILVHLWYIPAGDWTE